MIEVDEVSKRFGKCDAVCSVSLNMVGGRVYGTCGKNGAGKTTLIRLIGGMLVPDHGVIKVLGRDPAKEWRVRREIGLVEDGDGYFPELTVEEFLWWVGRLRGLDDSESEKQIETLLGGFYLDRRAEDLMGSLSHGMRRKTLLASAFVAKPKVLLLDEPTISLDVDSIDSLVFLLEKHRQEGGVAVIACHDQAFVNKVCSDVVELENGRVVARKAIRHSNAAASTSG